MNCSIHHTQLKAFGNTFSTCRWHPRELIIYTQTWIGHIQYTTRIPETQTHEWGCSHQFALDQALAVCRRRWCLPLLPMRRVQHCHLPQARSLRDHVLRSSGARGASRGLVLLSTKRTGWSYEARLLVMVSGEFELTEWGFVRFGVLDDAGGFEDCSVAIWMRRGLCRRSLRGLDTRL